MIIKEDVLLLRRVGQLLAAEAESVRVANEPFTRDPDSIKAKRLYDRVLRERRDLKSLEKRIEAQVHTEAAKVPEPA